MNTSLLELLGVILRIGSTVAKSEIYKGELKHVLIGESPNRMNQPIIRYVSFRCSRCGVFAGFSLNPFRMLRLAGNCPFSLVLCCFGFEPTLACFKLCIEVYDFMKKIGDFCSTSSYFCFMYTLNNSFSIVMERFAMVQTLRSGHNTGDAGL